MSPNSNVNKRTRPAWGAKVHTLNTQGANYGQVYNSSNSNDNNSTTNNGALPPGFKIQHIPNLSSNEHADALLKRIQSEFTIIAQKRGYNLSSVTEMCCCSDGLDHLQTNNKTKRGRKTRTMPANVLGYNLTMGRVNRIHLRLRHAKNHTFYSYDDIAGTMCHELAHCEIGPHNAKFYKLMDEIMEQHAVYMVRGVVMDQSGFPMGSNNARVLGGTTGTGTGIDTGNGNVTGTSSGSGSGTGTGTGGISSASGRNEREQAAKNRLQQKRLGMGGTFRLGGGFMPATGAGSYNASSSLAHLPPAEAVRRAAERRVEDRRRNDGQFCLPCQDVIEILDESSSDDEEEEEEDDKEEEEEDDKEEDGCDCVRLGPRGRDRDHGAKRNSKSNNITSTGTSTSTSSSSSSSSSKQVIQARDVDGKKQDSKGVAKRNVKGNVKSKTESKILPIKSGEQDIVVIDSDSSGDDNAAASARSQNKATAERPVRKKETNASAIQSSQKNLESDSSDIECSSWTCAKCTFSNAPEHFACQVCGHELNKKRNKVAIQKVLRDDAIEDVKRTEVENSMKEYGGFNIYGNRKRSTATLEHLT